MLPPHSVWVTNKRRLDLKSIREDKRWEFADREQWREMETGPDPQICAEGNKEENYNNFNQLKILEL